MKIRLKKKVTRSSGGNIAVFLFLSMMGAFTLLPILYATLNAFKPINELFLFPPRFFISHPTLDNFQQMLQLSQDMLVPIERYAFNSVFVTFVGTGLYIIIAALTAYPLAKHKFPGKFILMQLVVLSILFRPEVTAIPQYIVIAKLGLVNTYFALILPAISTSFGVFLMRQFMVSIPDEIIESARIDGCGELYAFWKIIMPMVKPAWLTLVIFTFQAMWNATGIQYIFSENMKMLPVALQQLSSAGIARAGVASAIALILMLPPIIIFILSQNSVIETMAHSGLKS